MELLTGLGLIGFVFRLSHKLTGLVFLWWRKEYRFDRMIVHLRTKQGISLWGGKTHALLVIFLLLWLLFPQTLSILSLFVFLVGVSYVRKSRTWMLPPKSPKVFILFLFSVVFIVLYLFDTSLPILIALTISDLLLFPLTAGIVGCINIPTVFYHQWVISKAVRKLRSHAPMKVIGITGSYGKTSVKEYLATILLSKFKTLKTEASKNSPIGIAETILRSLKPEHEMFVVEMGAYKRGEISKMAAMVKPEVGIITAINPQHQDLFGSIETTIKAKYELVMGLVSKRIVIANADDPKVKEMGERAKKDGKEVLWYSRTQAKNINSTLKGTEFDCVIGQENAHVKTSVIGEHQVSNILAAIHGAIAVGMKLKDAANAVSHIRPANGVMEIKKGIHGSVFIDDTFNNNPDAAKAAIAFLSKNTGKKILVFQPMIELGAYADSAHEEVGEAAAHGSDAIFLTNSNWYPAFERGVRRVSKSVPLMVSSPSTAVDYIRKYVKKGDMVLFKGKDAQHIYDALVS